MALWGGGAGGGQSPLSRVCARVAQNSCLAGWSDVLGLPAPTSVIGVNRKKPWHSGQRRLEIRRCCRQQRWGLGKSQAALACPPACPFPSVSGCLVSVHMAPCHSLSPLQTEGSICLAPRGQSARAVAPGCWLDPGESLPRIIWDVSRPCPVLDVLCLTFTRAILMVPSAVPAPLHGENQPLPLRLCQAAPCAACMLPAPGALSTR